MASTTSKTTLTVADLHATLEHEDHLGWGYACCTDLSDSVRTRLDKAIVAVANAEGLTADDLLTWSNSKHGRWLYDLVYGNDYSPTQATVRHHLTREIVNDLKLMEGKARTISTPDLEALQARLATEHRTTSVFSKVHVREMLWLVNSELATR